MALTVVGRHQFGALLAPLCVAQDQEDFDSFYFAAFTSGTLCIYKYTYPDTLALIVDTGLTEAGDFATYAFGSGAMSQDWMYGVGLIDATWHYCLYAYIPSGSSVMFVEANVDTGAWTQWTSGATWGPGPTPEIQPIYDGVGSYFALGTTDYLMKKRYGASTGSTLNVTGAGVPICMIDDQSWVSYRNDTFGYYKNTLSGSMGVTLLGTSYLPLASSIGASLLRYAYSVPGTAGSWDDDWRYIMAVATIGASQNNHVCIRKNIASGVYQVSIFTTDGQHSEGPMPHGMDIWQTGVTGAAGTVRKAFFSYGGQRNKVFSSVVYPLAVDNSLVLDEADTSAGMQISGIFTTTGGYAYVFIANSNTWGYACIKIYDADLAAGAASPAISLPGAVTLWKDKRVFFAGVTDYLRYLWWSQPFEPQSLDVGWDGYNTTVFDDEDIVALKAIEDLVYIGSKKGWMRLRGKSPDHWVLDMTLATDGPMNNKTVAITPFGAIYPRTDGLWLFNGYTSRLFFEQGKELMSQPNWDSVARMFSLWDGRFYRFYYPNGAATENNRELIIDLIGGPENPRGTEADRAASFGWADLPTGTVYLGDEDGNLWTLDGGTASRDLEITTKEYPAQGIIQAGSFAKLHYDLDAAGATVSVTPIYDGVAQTAISIPTNSTRTRGHILLPKGNVFRMGFKITASTAAAVKIYEPWVLE